MIQFSFYFWVEQLINLSTLNINPFFVSPCSPMFGVPLQQTKAGFVPAPRVPGPCSGMWQLLFLTANTGISILRVTPPSLRAIFFYFFVLGCSWEMVATRCKTIFFKRLVRVAQQGGEWVRPRMVIQVGDTTLTTSCCSTLLYTFFFNILKVLMFFSHLYCWMCDCVL